MVVLGCIGSPATSQAAGATLAHQRRADLDALYARLEQAKATGDLANHVGTRALAVFSPAVLQGLAIQARDGASRGELQHVIDAAMKAWEPLTAVT